ncbi:NAD-dependent epimerase/dehydratase family protein [Kitasatospora acidiphila]|uniref:NAD-dependent epimerase/dehydratase family protein n=1 Tax=Kitasatospora acidiphila TaxID=2567942 RepID=A0A540VYJ4_9ACTN|nr:NAD(P)H-binding protein [Kitasatospora acidiphila]TQF01825.1 NAD-dependent epimerase/dehydratase family protein [Kitasatospora acidiphila]
MGEILVTGATGNVGRHVVVQLLAAGAAVRALARDPELAELPRGVKVVGGDLSRPDTLEGALAGSDTVFLIWPFLTTDGAPAVLEAVAQHARRIVYLSSSGVSDDAERQTDPINQLHADMERLIEGSGLLWTFLRSNTIASNARGWAEQIRTTHLVRGPDIAATAVIHERDVAAVAVRALTDDGHTGMKHVLTGPQVLSRAEQVHAIGEAIGHPTRFEKVPVGVARQQMLADGRPPALVEALLASAEKRPGSNVITSAVEEITGAPARTFRSWAEEHADGFR